jgi:hypothetical protein
MKRANKDKIRQRYLAVDTSNVADILDTLGYEGLTFAEALAKYGHV